MVLFYTIFALFIFIGGTILEKNLNTEKLFGDMEERYNYCPTVIQLSRTSRYIFYCANKDSGIIRDHIYYRKGIYNKGKWTWGTKSLALSPSIGGWDSIHVCDPDVVKGEFRYDGHTYNWAMFYTGCDTLDNTHNQIGIAFSDSLDGPWIKWSGNPLISYPRDKWWGVGQPSVVSLDEKGQILLFYTRGDGNGTRMVWRKIDLSNMSSLSISEETTLLRSGLSEADGSIAILHNGALAYDREKDKLYLVRDKYYFDGKSPDFISSELEVAVTEKQNIFNFSGPWKVLFNITPSVSGKPRNHNACIVKDSFGYVPNKGYIEVAYTIAETGPFPSCLWTYRIYIVKVKVSN